MAGRPTNIGVQLRNNGVGSEAFICGTIATVGTGPIAVGTDTSVLSVLTIQVDPDNTNGIFLGSTSTQAIQLAPGQSYTVNSANLSHIEVKAQGADTDITVNYLGTVV